MKQLKVDENDFDLVLPVLDPKDKDIEDVSDTKVWNEFGKALVVKARM